MSRAEKFAQTLLKQKAGHAGEAVAVESALVSESETTVTTSDGLQQLNVAHLQRGRYQPRVDFPPQTLSELADSIRAQGVVQPIVVRPIKDGRFEILAGERRWRAAQLAGLTQVPVIVRSLDDTAAMTLALIENIQRENLNPIEEATALQTLKAHSEHTTGTLPTQQVLAAHVGKSVSWVSKRLALLERSEDIQHAVVDGSLSLDTAARRPANVPPPPGPRTGKVSTRALVRVDFEVLQASVRRLNQLADRLELPGFELPSRPARKDVMAAFESHAVVILDAAHRALDSK